MKRSENAERILQLESSNKSFAQGMRMNELSANDYHDAKAHSQRDMQTQDPRHFAAKAKMTIARSLIAISAMALVPCTLHAQVKPDQLPNFKEKPQPVIPRGVRMPDKRDIMSGDPMPRRELTITDEAISDAKKHYSDVSVDAAIPSPHLHSMDLAVESVGPIRTAGENAIQRRALSRYFDGFIYPSSTPVNNSYAHGAFELDSPIATDANPTKQYYAFGLSLKHKGDQDLEVSFDYDRVVRNGIRAERQTWIGAESVAAGDCGRTMADMHERSYRDTGVKSYAAYNDRTDQLLAEGKPVFWESCQSPSTGADRWGNELSHIVVLVPTSLIGNQTHMNVRTTIKPTQLRSSNRNQIGGIKPPNKQIIGRGQFQNKDPVFTSPERRTVSRELEIPLFHSKPMMAVIGDSMAWGQGLSESEKYYKIVANNISRDMDISVHARSGAQTLPTRVMKGIITTDLMSDTDVVNNVGRQMDAIALSFGPSTLREVDIDGAMRDACTYLRDTHGEVPGATPNTPCQIAHSSQMICRATRPNSPATKFECSKNTPNFPRLDGFASEEDRISDGGEFMIDIRARYDYALMSTCMNDLGAYKVLFGLDDEESLAKLGRQVRMACDLRHGLGYIREYYPNALIMVTDYHRFATDESFLNLCYPREPHLDDRAQDRLAVALGLARLSVDTGVELRGSDGLGNIATVNDFIRQTFTDSIELAADISGLRDLGARNLDLPMSVRLNRARQEMRDIRRRNLNQGDRYSIQGRSDFSGGRGVITMNETQWTDNDGMFGSSAKSFGLQCRGSVERLIDSVGDRDLGRVIEILGGIQAEDEESVARVRQPQCAHAYYGTSLAVTRDHLMCKIASAGHPNSSGARRIADTIIEKVNGVDGKLTGIGNSLSPSGTNLRRIRR